MERVLKIGKTLRNNWKKSVFGSILLYYGAVKIKEKYDIKLLMRAACKEAAKYGDSLIPMDRNPTHITVILNPVANKRKAKKEYEKYCEPLLHLAGLQVEVIQTTSEGNAKDVIESLKGTEAIIVAGGDGTLSETVTGLLRRNDDANQFPLGILPLGRTNSLGNTMFPTGEKPVDKVKQLIDASMAIIVGNIEWKDAMKIEPINREEDETSVSRPIYAMSSIECGAFRDTLAKKDKYWFCGPFRKYAAFIFNGYKDSLAWNCSGEIKYTPPCIGCNNCTQKKQETLRKWSFFIPTTNNVSQLNQLALNPDCATLEEMCFKTSELQIKTRNGEKSNDLPALMVQLGKLKYSYTEFISDGWNRVKGIDIFNQTVPVRTLHLVPKDAEKIIMEIDQEEFEVKPIKITLLPKILKFFCK